MPSPVAIGPVADAGTVAPVTQVVVRERTLDDRVQDDALRHVVANLAPVLAKCAALDAASGSEWTRWAQLHRDIIVRFGRFPHRNACLGRASTAAELEFLAQGGFAG